MDRRHGEAHGAPGRTSRPLSEVPANVLNRRPGYGQVPKPPAWPNVPGAHGIPTAQPFSQGTNGSAWNPWLNGFGMTGTVSSCSMTDGDGQTVNTGFTITAWNEVTLSDGRRFIIDGGIKQTRMSNGQIFINGINIEQIARDNERKANLEAARHQAGTSSFPLPAPAQSTASAQSTALPGRQDVHKPPPPPKKPKATPPSFLPPQFSRASTATHSAVQSKILGSALSNSPNTHTPSSRHTTQELVTPSLTQSRSHHRPPSLPRPAIPDSTASTATTPRSKSSEELVHEFLEHHGLNRSTEALRPPVVKRKPGPSIGVAGAPARQHLPGQAARTSRVKAEPSTSTRVSTAAAIARPPSHPRIANNSPNITSALSTGQAQRAGASVDLLRSVRPSTMPPLYLSSGDDSDHGSASDEDGDGMGFHGMADNMQPRPNAMEELGQLLDLPPIDMLPEDRAKTPAEMSITLMEHQKVALRWLMDQEKNRSKKGGLLADTMGLGKTIEALALIVAHKPPALSNGPKTTLIVAPLALLRQWKREIEEKLKPVHRLSVFIYHGRDKKTKNADRLHNYDVVITTYETIASEHNKRGPSGRAASPLFRHPKGFYRIILDEAHKIKNRKTACSKAVVDLRAEFRLCMTGTPFMNNTAEIFSQLRFLRIAPYCDWNHFNKDIETPLRKWDNDDKAEAMRKLQVLFRSITLRRTKDSTLDKKPILTLPKLTVTPTEVELDEEQRAYYTAIEKKHQILVNKYLKHNRLSKVYTYILVLLLRLRQVCDHPFLIKTHGIPEEATLNSKQMVTLALKFDKQVVNQVMKKKEFVCPLCDEPVEIAMIVFPCGHDLCPECFSTMMQASGRAKKNNEESQLALDALMGGDADMETKCPHDGCLSDILPNKVVCHDHFLDAHSPGSSSQVQELDSGDDDSDAFSSSDDEDEDDSDDDGEDLRDFIVSDGEEDSEVDSDESEGDEDVDDEPQSKIERSGARSRVDRHPDRNASATADEIEDSDTTPQEDEGTSAEEDVDEAGVKDEENAEDVASGPCQGRALTPDPFADDEEADLSQSDGENEVPEVKHADLDLGNDVWGLTLARLRNVDTAKSDEESDSNSDSDLESLSAVIAKAKPTSAPAAEHASNPLTTKRKRAVKSRNMPVKKKRKEKQEDDEEEEEEDFPNKARKSRRGGKREKKKKKKGMGKTMAQLKKAASGSKAGKLKYFDRLRRDWETSAKVDVTVDLLRKIRQERPHEKTLVFSLWTSFLDLLEIPMQDEKFRYLRYDGGMTHNERDDNIKAFSEDPRENILLVSLMAGNAGLNLTAATQVIIVEPFWNPFVEDQAIDRAHRIGQKKEVQVYKLLVPDSVEDRILELQEKKRSLVNTALSEEGAQGASRLSLTELRGLFGLR